MNEKKSISTSNLLFDTDSSSYDINAFNYGNAPVSVAIDIDQSLSQYSDKSCPFMLSFQRTPNLP